MKQRIALLLIVVLMAVLAACSGGAAPADTPAPAVETETGDASAEPAEEQKAEEQPAAEEPEPAGPEFDLGGREIVVTTWWDIVLGDTPEAIMIKENIDRLQKKHNFTLKFTNTPYDKITELTTSSVLAGEPFADVVRLERRGVFPTMVNSDLITPISDVADLNSPDYDFIAPIMKSTIATFKGKIWGWENSYNDFSGIYYNKKLLKELGLKDLHDYVEEGSWNWATFMDVAKQATKGSTYGFTGSQKITTELAVVSNGSNFVDLEKGVEMLSDPRTLEALTFVQDLYKSGYGFFAPDSATRKAEFTKGNVLMISGVQWEGESYANDLGAENLGFVPFPLGPQGTEFRSVSNPPNFWIIPKGVKDADKVLYLVGQIFKIESTEEYPNQNRLERYFTDEKDIMAAREMGQAPAYTVLDLDSYRTFEIYKLLEQLTGEMLAPATIVEQHRQVLQAEVEAAVK